MVLKPNSGVDMRQGSSHKLRGSNCQVDFGFITRIIIILLISTCNIN